ncbi:phosphonate ABC transporter ATP-binding protein [Pikeienuella piscinae]|uniref:Phosphonate ABC transporter ATP-binding protein n=1 Tax=Pikeienuella piscinae TaxID=2748098 RepID=A0A7L5BT91_9RHOB|nr:phosphonate ABC transporter ATP-binding protein [Pikeienuella piscinae]QIE54191.1 phosphonate ABC transporter ATP-binding protein [Pikeienuella piscinae]
MMNFESPADGSALRIHNLVKEYRAGQPVLKGINLEVAPSGVTAIIGPSGTGKSTLIRCINRLVDPTSGEVWFDGQDLAALKGAQLRLARRKIGMVFQEYNLVERLSVIENILCGRLGYAPLWRVWLRRFLPEDVERAFTLIERVGLDESFVRRRADQLSGGQRQRVGIARALMQRPRLMLADEPTSSLDPRTSTEIMDLLSELAERERVPVVINIHNVDLARRCAGRIIGLANGAVVFDGPPEALEHAHLVEIYGGEGWLQ